MGFKLNLTNDEIKKAQGSFEPLAAGVYGAVIFEAEEKVSRAGNDMYRINYKITEGPEGVGRKIYGYYTVAGNALFAVNGLLKATGHPYPDKDTPAGDFDFPDAEEFLGQEVNIKITREPYVSEDDTGKEITAYRNNVAKVFAYDADKISTSDEDEGETTTGGQFL